MRASENQNTETFFFFTQEFEIIYVIVENRESFLLFLSGTEKFPFAINLLAGVRFTRLACEGNEKKNNKKTKQNLNNRRI